MFKTVTVTVTLWPMVIEPVGKIATLVTTILGFTIMGIVTECFSEPAIPVTITA